MEFQSVRDILDFAITKEQEAHDMYADLAGKVERPELQKTFREFAQMELGHRARLEKIKAGELPGFTDEAVENLKLSDFLLDVTPRPSMGYQDVILFAMKAEKRAHDLYVGLGKATQDARLRQVFKGLAQEELKHKHFFETEYDEFILEGN
ncbi:MAG: ferritin family protein [Acidobacteria bacterium]|nr:ferritin family protein [Acidobacteriota bacterium]